MVRPVGAEIHLDIFHLIQSKKGLEKMNIVKIVASVPSVEAE